MHFDNFSTFLQPRSRSWRYGLEKCQKMKGKYNMTKTLKVVEPFFGMEAGDELELSQDGKMYTSEYNSEYHENAEDDSASAVYNSSCSISPTYARQLLKEGFLEEVVAKSKTEDEKPFVNVFDEIDAMLTTYKTDLANIDIDDRQLPAALKVEKRTVLENLIKALDHLKNLRK